MNINSDSLQQQTQQSQTQTQQSLLLDTSISVNPDGTLNLGDNDALLSTAITIKGSDFSNETRPYSSSFSLRSKQGLSPEQNHTHAMSQNNQNNNTNHYFSNTPPKRSVVAGLSEQNEANLSENCQNTKKQPNFNLNSQPNQSNLVMPSPFGSNNSNNNTINNNNNNNNNNYDQNTTISTQFQQRSNYPNAYHRLPQQDHDETVRETSRIFALNPLYSNNDMILNRDPLFSTISGKKIPPKKDPKMTTIDNNGVDQSQHVQGRFNSRSNSISVEGNGGSGGSGGNQGNTSKNGSEFTPISTISSPLHTPTGQFNPQPPVSTQNGAFAGPQYQQRQLGGMVSVSPTSLSHNNDYHNHNNNNNNNNNNNHSLINPQTNKYSSLTHNTAIKSIHYQKMAQIDTLRANDDELALAKNLSSHLYQYYSEWRSSIREVLIISTVSATLLLIAVVSLAFFAVVSSSSREFVHPTGKWVDDDFLSWVQLTGIIVMLYITLTKSTTQDPFSIQDSEFFNQFVISTKQQQQQQQQPQQQPQQQQQQPSQFHQTMTPFSSNIMANGNPTGNNNPHYNYQQLENISTTQV
jgi:hypothetical protein